MNIQRCCLFGRVPAKISKFKLKQVYATSNMHSRASGDIQSRAKKKVAKIELSKPGLL
jgi:hypothetical protein